ncbi:hypothetical protein [Streptomyces sp. AVP053U2]|uniref:hypothetical protein n=1 Tax=Streptomyces sp. AVP053U2 TaxID=1737066 RepID=UPI00073B6270|nr:hypothetical protein [Streptomyces sp. AVP053U2]ODA75636.1 hypothetical protein APS67_000199 [Streptomyces sp. AVP053U2]
MAPCLPDVERIMSGNNNVEMLLGNQTKVMGKWSTTVDVENLNATLYILQLR